MPIKKPQILIAAAVVVAGVSTATYFYFKGLAEQFSTPIEMATVVPEAALATAFISPNAKAFAQLQKFGTPESQKWLDRSLKSFQQQSLAGTDINFDRDLKPWISGIAVALLPAPPTAEKSARTTSPQLLLTLAIKNNLAAWNFAKRLKSQPEAKVQESDYKGVKISEIVEKTGKRYSFAVVGDRLMMAPVKGPIESAIDTVQGKTSLANNAKTATILSQNAGLSNPIATIFIPDYSATVQQLTANLPANSRPSSVALTQLKQIKSVVLGVGIDPAGVRVRAVSQLDPRIAAQQNQPTQSKLTSRFPTETIALFTGVGLSQIWSQISTEANNNPELQQGLEQIRLAFRRINLDADKEVFGWMNGEFAVGTIASDREILSQLGMGFAMIFETDNRAAAEAALAKLDTIAKSNASVSVTPKQVQGTQVTEWRIPQQGTLFGHGWVDNSVFIAFGGPLVEAMTIAPATSLNSSANFQKVIGSLPQPNQGYFYLDVEKGMTWANRYLLAAQPNLLPSDTIVLLNSLQGIGIATTWPEPATAQLELLLAPKPKS